MSDGARGRSTGIFSSIWRALFGGGRPNDSAAAAMEDDDALFERREAGFQPDGSDARVVVRSGTWDLGESDVREGIRHADAAFERGFAPRPVDVVDAAEEHEAIDEAEVIEDYED